MNFLANFLTSLKPRVDDDIIDRLNYYYTCLILLLLAITISAKQYVGQPIQCWVPAQFTGAWEQYAENYCFIQNTYWLPLVEPIPDDRNTRVIRQIGYYQWVPFLLAIQAMLFYLPCVLWRLFSWQSGINVQSVVKMATDTQNIGSDTRERTVNTIARHMEDSLEFQHRLRYHQAICSPVDRPVTELVQYWRRVTTGTCVTAFYLLVKFLYLVNVTGQFFLLSSFLAPTYRFWGAEILIDLINGREWHDSGHFPRVTMCDFEVRVLGNLHRYTIQCVLMINMFNEKVFLFIWWWFLFVGIANGLSFLYWTVCSICYSRRCQFILRYLHGSEEKTDQLDTLPQPIDHRFVRKFVIDFLRLDGIFVLRMISQHAGDLITTEIVATLWRMYRNRYIPFPYLIDQSSHGDSNKVPPYTAYTNRGIKTRRSTEDGTMDLKSATAGDDGFMET